MNKRIAIVGGGIAGLTAAYLLNKKYDITLFEKYDRVGGNAYTHKTSTGEMIDIAVGSVVKQIGAKNFLNLCDEVNVQMVRQFGNGYVSIHDLETDDGLYVTPLSLKGLFAQKFALYRSFTLIKILRAIYKATKLLDEGKLRGLSTEEALKLLPELKRMENFFITGFLCTVSCMYYEEILKGPAEYFIGKLNAFRLLDPISMLFGNYFPMNFTQSYYVKMVAIVGAYHSLNVEYFYNGKY